MKSTNDAFCFDFKIKCCSVPHIVQNKSSYTGAEYYVAGLLEIKDQSWVPQRNSRSLQVAHSSLTTYCSPACGLGANERFAQDAGVTVASEEGGDGGAAAPTKRKKRRRHRR